VGAGAGAASCAVVFFNSIPTAPTPSVATTTSFLISIVILSIRGRDLSGPPSFASQKIMQTPSKGN